MKGWRDKASAAAWPSDDNELKNWSDLYKNSAACMVLILDGSLEIGAQVSSNFCYFIYYMSKK